MYMSIVHSGKLITIYIIIIVIMSMHLCVYVLTLLWTEIINDKYTYMTKQSLLLFFFFIIFLSRFLVAIMHN